MTSSNYTCGEYRLEMLLISLQRRLADSELSQIQKQRIEAEIKALEKQMGLD